MGEIAPFLVPISLFVTAGAVLIFRGPFGKALAERISGRVPHSDGHGTESLRAEVEEMRYRITEMEERLDFAERMLAQHRDSDQLPPPR
jgi:hypothetical protein